MGNNQLTGLFLPPDKKACMLWAQSQTHPGTNVPQVLSSSHLCAGSRPHRTPTTPPSTRSFRLKNNNATTNSRLCETYRSVTLQSAQGPWPIVAYLFSSILYLSNRNEDGRIVVASFIFYDLTLCMLLDNYSHYTQQLLK